jgi:single stranded DNA-binding protein (ssb)
VINRVVLVGRLTKDPELRKTQSGLSVTSFTVAVNRRKQEDKPQEADFIGCVAWNRSADFITQYGRKGALVGIEGRIQTRTYDDASGKKVYVTEVVCDSVQLLESKRDNDKALEEVSMDYVIEEAPTLDISSDDLPF